MAGSALEWPYARARTRDSRHENGLWYARGERRESLIARARAISPSSNEFLWNIISSATRRDVDGPRSRCHAARRFMRARGWWSHQSPIWRYPADHPCVPVLHHALLCIRLSTMRATCRDGSEGADRAERDGGSKEAKKKRESKHEMGWDGARLDDRPYTSKISV